MEHKMVALRCDDRLENCVFNKYIYNGEPDIAYEINIEDSYIGGDYRGFFGRVKRAWRAFWAKPVCYSGIYTDDKNKMRKFLSDCLELVNEDDAKQFKDFLDKAEEVL